MVEQNAGQTPTRPRIAVITGGAGGLGYAIGRRLAANGDIVVLWDIDRDAVHTAAETLSGARAFVVDVTRQESVEGAVKQTLQEFGCINVLINSAGITGPNQLLTEYSYEEWRRVMAINLDGVFLCCRAVVPVMLTGENGRIVNLASIAGKEGNPNASCYSASKAGVIALTKSLGKELAQTSIRVNCVAPAAIETDLLRQMTPEFTQFVISKIPMGRLGQPDEVAAMVEWLASPTCSFSTGAVFDISGGRATY
jgi:NAD(P)-dependent dehydrogenase (short-subunit alcohol dehydrogenase family)